MANKFVSGIEEILQFYAVALGKNYNSYRNHVYRVYHLSLLLAKKDFSKSELQELAVASAFHDLGVWIHRTMDYLDSSIDMAQNHCENQGIDQTSVKLIINHHHQFSIYSGQKKALVESFRRADLADLSFGIIRFGLPRKLYQNLKEEFPFLGFHQLIYKMVLQHALSHPTKPFPMIRK